MVYTPCVDLLISIPELLATLYLLEVLDSDGDLP